MARYDRKELIELFLRGESQRLVALPLSTFERAKCTELLVGALVLRGEFDRAAAVGSRRATKSAVAAFYLSLGYSRTGRYEEATRQIQRLSLATTSKSLIPFYRAQAEGFKWFVQGRFLEASEKAKEALTWAETSTDPLQALARILSLDLLGHSLAVLGQAQRGILALKQARDLAIQLRHENFKDAISVSLLKYDAVFGLDPHRIIARLSKALIELKPDDSYSRSELRLELSRQLILRGSLRQARRHLEASAEEIVGSQNYLQTAALHLRIAWIARLENRADDALFSLLAAGKGLAGDPQGGDTHRDLNRKIAQFRNEILRESGRRSDVVEVRGQAVSLVERRLSARRARAENFSESSSENSSQNSTERQSASEDPFGDLMDRVSERRDGIERELLTHGYFGLLLPIIGLNFSQTCVVLGAPNEAVIVVVGGEARSVRGGFGGILGRLLMRLSEGSISKQQAIEDLWGYRYEADRHDRLLIVAISRIRKALGEGSSWLELSGPRLALRNQVLVRSWPHHSLENSSRAILIPPRVSPEANKTHLRLRQLQVLADLATRGDVGVRDLTHRFGVSRAAALRDLNELVDLGLLIRLGETRATRYVLKKGFSI